jgi:hypothetical protein
MERAVQRPWTSLYHSTMIEDATGTSPLLSEQLRITQSNSIGIQFVGVCSIAKELSPDS